MGVPNLGGSRFFCHLFLGNPSIEAEGPFEKEGGKAVEDEGIIALLWARDEAGLRAAGEIPAALDLRDLLLAYAGTHSAPDLGSFRYSGGQD